MAVFLINICKFNGCGITFQSLSDLIQHIEDTHIDYDPQVLEQKEKSQPACLPLSYVLRFISDSSSKKETPAIPSTPTTPSTTPNTGTDVKRKNAIKHHSYSMSSSNRSATPTGSEMDDEDMMISESEDSNDSWTTEEFSSEFIMRYGSRHSSNGLNSSNEKPFACPVPGCKKRYKNVNGIKYHSKNGHKKDGKVRKGFKCHCGKSYKTSQRLKNHTLLHHQNVSTLLNDANANLVTRTDGTLTSSSSSSSSSTMTSSTASSSSNNVITQTNFVSNENSSQIGLSIVANKLPRLVASASPSSSSSPLSTASTSSLNGKYDNLGTILLTPATSPKLALLHQQETNSSTNNNHNNSNNNNNNHLPMTPMSPNKTAQIFTTSSSSAATATTQNSLNDET